MNITSMSLHEIFATGPCANKNQSITSCYIANAFYTANTNMLVKALNNVIM